MKTIFAAIKSHKIIAGLLVIIIGTGSFFGYKKIHKASAEVQYVTQAAAKTTINVAVSATGQVSAENQIDLKPGSSGKLTSVNVKAGDAVKAGQTVAVVDQSSNSVAIAQAQASVLQAQASYDKVVAGLTGTDLTVAQRALDSAKAAVDTAKKNYGITLDDQNEAVARANNTLLNSGLVLVPSNLLTTATLTMSGVYTGSVEGQYKITSYSTTGSGVFYTVSGLGNSFGPINRGTANPLGNGLFITFGNTGEISPSTTWTIDVPNKTSSQYFTNLTAYNAAVSSRDKALDQAQDNIKSAEDALTDAQLSFDQKTAPPDKPEVASARASLLSARAQLQSASNNYNNNVLKAPFDGVVAALNNKTGDEVTAATAVATIITKQQIASISLNEVDVAKVKVGQKSTLAFDAIDDLSLTGQVVEVSSLGTTTQGVVSYAVKIGFDTQDDRVKPSMSLSADIITDTKVDVLAVPNSAVKTNGSGKYVQTLDASGKPQDVTVEVGLSNDTQTEIVSGIKVGDKVVTQTINPSAKTTTSKSNSGTAVPGLGGNTFTGGGSSGRTGAPNATFEIRQ